MEPELSYIEKSLKLAKTDNEQYYDHILSGEELFEFIRMMTEHYAGNVDTSLIRSESDKLISGDFFRTNREAIIQNRLSREQTEEFRKSFSEQTENAFLNANYDISCSRVLRYMPAQWHYSSYFLIYFVKYGNCEIVFHGENVEMKKGSILIIAPFIDHATPCCLDDAVLEYFLIRSSSFEKVFWDQLNRESIMAHFFRKALKNQVDSPTSYLMFETALDPDIFHLIDQIKEELRQKLPYSSSLINALMSAFFSLTLRRYENTVSLPSEGNGKWKKEYSRIFSCIQDRFAHATLQEIADECGYSAKQVSRIVSNYFNMSYSEFVLFLKMEKAITLLNEKTLSIAEISSQLGYSDLPSFYRAFKKYYQLTPAQYLQQDVF